MITTKQKSKTNFRVIFNSRVEKDHLEIADWCENTFGTKGRNARWRYGWTQNEMIYHFHNKKDMLLFLLRWS